MCLTPKSVSRILTEAYPKGDMFTRLFVRLRPFIYPFHEIVELVPQNSSILDIGCGIGLMPILLSHLGRIKKAVGVDTSRKAIQIARNALLLKNSEVTFRLLLENDPWPDGNFDVIICIDVLHHIPAGKQYDFIQRLAAVTTGTRVVFKDVTSKPVWRAKASVIHDLLVNKQWIHIQEEGKVKEWFRNEGFYIQTDIRIDMLWYSHYLLVAEKISQVVQ